MRAPALSIPRANDTAQILRTAFGEAIQFTINPGTALVVPDDQIKSFAEEEASFGRISVDADGVTAGMKLHILQPAQNLIAEWAQVKGAFVTALQPFKQDIDAVDKLDQEVGELRNRRVSVQKQIERQAEADPEYVQIKSDYERKRDTFEDLHDRAGRRKITMGRYNPLYWVAMLFIGVAEWLINYDTFFIFMGVPAIAAGTTIILGVLLAFSADGHGTLLKQWTAKFGRDVPPEKRRSSYLYLTLSTFGLLIVLWAAGGFRYAIAIHLVSGQPSINILGAQATIVINPLRDVLLSLLANLAAWAVGVFIAYLSHDENPDLMGANHDYQKALRRFSKRQRPTTVLIKTEEAKIEREINEKERSAITRARDVTEQREMFHQIRSHEQTVLNGILSTIRRNAETYRDQLTQNALSRKGAVLIVQGDAQLTPYDYKALDINISADRIAATAGHW